MFALRTKLMFLCAAVLAIAATGCAGRYRQGYAVAYAPAPAVTTVSYSPGYSYGYSPYGYSTRSTYYAPAPYYVAPRRVYVSPGYVEPRRVYVPRGQTRVIAGPTGSRPIAAPPSRGYGGGYGGGRVIVRPR